MRNHLKVLMVVGLLMLMMPLLFGYVSPLGASHPNTIGDHKASKNITNQTCNNCHDRMTEVGGTAANPTAHRRHFTTAFLNFIDEPDTKGCGRCHEETVYGGNVYYSDESYAGQGSGYEGDLSYNDTDSPNSANFARAARKQVKPDVCESCHGQFRSAQHSGNNYAQTDPRGCVRTGCHVDAGTGGAPAVVHAAVNYINTSYANSTVFCIRCHGELAWYQTAETTLTLP